MINCGMAVYISVEFFFSELLWFVGQREEKLRCEFQRTQSDNGGIEGNGRDGR